MLRLLGAVCRPVAKFRNQAEFRKRDFSAGRTRRPPSGQKGMGLESNVRAGGILWTWSDPRWQGEWFHSQLDLELAYHVEKKVNFCFRNVCAVGLLGNEVVKKKSSMEFSKDRLKLHEGFRLKTQDGLLTLSPNVLLWANSCIFWCRRWRKRLQLRGNDVE